MLSQCCQRDTPNTFLGTEETFGDFALELEFQVDPEIKSGVQVRSLSEPHYQDGRVHGYQIEIDPSQRAWSAGRIIGDPQAMELWGRTYEKGWEPIV